MGKLKILATALIAFLLTTIQLVYAKPADTLGEKPVPCGPGGCYGYDFGPNYLSNTYSCDVTLSPEIVEPGGVIKATMATHVLNGINWPELGERQEECAPAGTYGTVTCSWKVGNSTTSGWQRASFYCFGVEEVAYAIQGGVIQGHVTLGNGDPIAGVKIGIKKVSGKNGPTYSAMTDGSGYYQAIVGKGKWKVSANADVCVQPVQNEKCSSNGTVTLGSNQTVDFKARSAGSLEGTVLDHRGDAVDGLVLDITDTGTNETFTAATDESGRYVVPLENGNYHVAPRTTTIREMYEPGSADVTVNSAAAKADFKLKSDDLLDITSPISAISAGIFRTTVQANGTETVLATVEVFDARNAARENEPVLLKEPYWDVPPTASSQPGLLYCDPEWNRLYPGLGNANVTTDDNGRFKFNILFGTDQGNIWAFGEEASDTTVSGFEILAQSGTAGGNPDPLALSKLAQFASSQGFPAAPLAGPTAAVVQESMLEWLLGLQALSGAGFTSFDFGPIRSADGQTAALIFYPKSNAGPLRDHFQNGAALPSGYEPQVVPIQLVNLVVTSNYQAVIANPVALPSWEGQFGAAVPGYLTPHQNEQFAFFGFPYPPPSTKGAARAAYSKCLPGAAPRMTTVEVHSPVRLMFSDSGGRHFGLDKSGNIINEDVGGFYFSGEPSFYVVPQGDTGVEIEGTGSGPVSMLVRNESAQGSDVQNFQFKVKNNKSGKLALSSSGAAGTLTFAGKKEKATKGVGLKVKGIPNKIQGGKEVSVTLAVSDQFGAPLNGAFSSLTEKTGGSEGLTDTAGAVTLALSPAPSKGSLNLAVSAPGYQTFKKKLRVQKVKKKKKKKGD